MGFSMRGGRKRSHGRYSARVARWSLGHVEGSRSAGARDRRGRSLTSRRADRHKGVRQRLFTLTLSWAERKLPAGIGQKVMGWLGIYRSAA